MSRRALAQAPRVALGVTPTPLAYLQRLTDELGGPRIYVKRDDLTGLAFGGNKVRKLEYLVGEALKLGCDTLVTTGAIQSNHARQTAAAAARCGLDCHLLLVDAVDQRGPEYHENGNVLLDRLLGATTIAVGPPDMDTDRALKDHARRLERRGRRPYVVPAGGSTATGCLGYVAAAAELTTQLRSQRIYPTQLFHASSSGGTQAGLSVGLEQAGFRGRLTGVAVGTYAAEQRRRVRELIDATRRRLGLAEDPTEPDVDDHHVGPGYGHPDHATLDAIGIFARLEGLLLDPVYTGKAAAALLSWVRDGRLTSADTVVLLHLGGQPSLFAYAPELRHWMNKHPHARAHQ